MRQWEYAVVVVPAAQIQNAFNALEGFGLDGWELTTSIPGEQRQPPPATVRNGRLEVVQAKIKPMPVAMLIFKREMVDGHKGKPMVLENLHVTGTEEVVEVA